MKTTIGMLVVSLALGGCIEGGTSDDDDEYAAEHESDGKADGFGVPLGSYENAQPVVGTIVTLELAPADEDDEFPSYYDGRYQLTEFRAAGTHEASGAFNVYTYGDTTWIRFIDESGEGFGSTYEKYSVVQQEGQLVLQGHGASSSFTLSPVEAAPGRLVTCTLTRLAVEGMPQGPGSTSATVNPDEEEAYGDSDDGLDAFEGSYSFSLSMFEGSLDVIFYENAHVQDEVGSLGCDLDGVVPGQPFCQESVTVDASLATGEEERIVHAFDFACVLTVD